MHITYVLVRISLGMKYIFICTCGLTFRRIILRLAVLLVLNVFVIIVTEDPYCLPPFISLFQHICTNSFFIVNHLNFFQSYGCPLISIILRIIA